MLISNKNQTNSSDNLEPVVSVIMNCYNGDRYLREAIDSVLAQSYINWEIIFWDNQSTDNSAEIFNSYNDNRLKYYFAPNHTFLYQARNLAIQKSNCKFVAFLDVDDWWENNKLEKQLPLFEDSSVGLVCSNYLIINEVKRSSKLFRTKKIPTGWVLNNLLLDYPVGMLTLVIRREAIDSLSEMFNPSFNIIGDMDLVVRLGISWKMACNQEPLAFYRFHGENLGEKQKERQVVEYKIWLSKVKKNPDITCLTGYKKVVNEFAYMQGLLYINENNKDKAIQHFHSLYWSKYKVKLWLRINIPKKLFFLLNDYKNKVI